MSTRYSPAAIALHWAMALGLTVLFLLGLLVGDMAGSADKTRLLNLHRWFGLLMLLLAGWRLVVRLRRGPPDGGAAGWPARLARAAHALMYGLFFAIPLAGWAMSSARGRPVSWFGVLPLPDFVPVDKLLGQQLELLHSALAWTLCALVLLHVAVVLKHRLIDRDDLLERMLRP